MACGRIRVGYYTGGLQGGSHRHRFLPPNQRTVHVSRDLGPGGEAGVRRKTPVVVLEHVAPITLVEPALDLDDLPRLQNQVPRELVAHVIRLSTFTGGNSGRKNVCRCRCPGGQQPRPIHPGLDALGRAVAVEPVAHFHVVQVQR